MNLKILVTNHFQSYFTFEIKKNLWNLPILVMTTKENTKCS